MSLAILCCLPILWAFQCSSADPVVGGEAKVWVTTHDMSRKLAPADPVPFAPAGQGGNSADAKSDALRVTTKIRHQKILGLGSSFEHSTCYNLSRLEPKERDEAIARLVDPNIGIGMNLMRICIGTPDFTGDPWYSYDDSPSGEPDPQLKHFSIEKDRRYILPVLKTAREKNPQLLLFASPWSPPAWMKSSKSMIGGRLLPEYYPVYANYFVRFLQAYQQEGLPIHAVTVQNEPGVDRERDPPKWHYPSCRWTADEECAFIRDHLGPAIKNSGLSTEIWCYDHNFNVEPTPDGDDPGIDYPRRILSDPLAAKFVAGVAFHGYAGKPDGMLRLHKEFPDTPVYFTEGSVLGLLGAKRIMDLFNNGASCYNAWVTILDDAGKPNNGPFPASRTCVAFDSKRNALEYNLDYYLYGQFMKFIRRGAVRLEVERPHPDCPAVAFQNPGGDVVVIVSNPRVRDKSVDLVIDDLRACLTFPARSLTTIVLGSKQL